MRYAVVLVLVFCVAGVAVGDDLDDCRKAASALRFRDHVLIGLTISDTVWWKAARRSCTKAAEQGHAQAQYTLGVITNGVCRDQGSTTKCDIRQKDAKASKWYTKAAKQGHASAQWELGTLYEYGWGVPQDYIKAVEWYTKAAEQGVAPAQYHLGHMYHHSKGVPQDYAKAVEWWTKAAEQGHAYAQYRLYLMYRDGVGVPQDDAKAAEWLTRAAKSGLPYPRQIELYLDE